MSGVYIIVSCIYIGKSEVTAMRHAVQQALQHWQYIQPTAMIPKNEAEYKKLSSLFNSHLKIKRTTNR